MKLLKRFGLLCSSLLLTACAINSPAPDMTALKKSDPKSILILPPVNKTVEVEAEDSIYSASFIPVADAGYYPIPVVLTKEIFKTNGLTEPEDIKNVPLAKLREVFGADAVLYLTVTDFGSQYQIVQSHTQVSVVGTLVDAKTGEQLWVGVGIAEKTSGGSGIGALIGAVVAQAINSATNLSHELAVQAAAQMVNPLRLDKKGLLFGPRSPHYRKDGQ